MLLGHFWTGLKRAECCYLTAHISMDFSSPPAQTSTMVSNHSLHSLPFQKWDKKFPLGLKTPYRCTQLMHFTSKHPALFLWEKKSVPQRENTACFMNAAIIRHNTLLLCWMFSSLGHTEKHWELIRSHQFELNAILYLSEICLLPFRLQMKTFHCSQTCSLQF